MFVPLTRTRVRDKHFCIGGGGGQTFLHQGGGQIFGGCGGYDNVNKEMDVSKANILVSKASIQLVAQLA